VITGVSVATVLFLSFLVEKLLRVYSYPVFRLEEFLWPSSIFLMATDGGENTLGSYLIVLLAIVTNGLLYFFAGAFFWLVGRLGTMRMKS
jgi:hypothetical protein